MGGVAFEKAAHAASHSARIPPERHAPAASNATRAAKRLIAAGYPASSFDVIEGADGRFEAPAGGLVRHDRTVPTRQ